MIKKVSKVQAEGRAAELSQEVLEIENIDEPMIGLSFLKQKLNITKEINK